MILYSTETCPLCNVVKKKFAATNISYESCMDQEVMKKLGISRVPVLEKDGELMEFSDIIKWIKEVENS